MYKKNELLKTACGSPCYAAPEVTTTKTTTTIKALQYNYAIYSLFYY